MPDGKTEVIRSSYLVGCDGGSSAVRQALDIRLRGESNLLALRQALYRCDELFEKLPIGNGPGRGRHYHVADDKASFLIMQDSTKHWTLHATVETDEDMKRQFEKIVGIPVKYEMLSCNPWRQNLLVADHYQKGRVFLAGDAVHLVIPTGGLGMNSGVGDAIDLGWKLAATLQGWGGPKLLESYEIERRQIGDRNVGASRYANIGRRKWRSMWRPDILDDTPAGNQTRDALAAVADVEQRKSNEMIGAELGYRYVNSPVICDIPGGPEHRVPDLRADHLAGRAACRTYGSTTARQCRIVLRRMVSPSSSLADPASMSRVWRKRINAPARLRSKLSRSRIKSHETFTATTSCCCVRTCMSFGAAMS